MNSTQLCPFLDTRKNNRSGHLADYRTEIADAGEMMVNTTSELINLAEARHEVMPDVRVGVCGAVGVEHRN